MPSRSESERALRARTKNGGGGLDFDGFRRDTYSALEKHTGRPLVVFATDFLNSAKVKAIGDNGGISLNDRDGAIEVTRQIKGEKVDFLISSPGGSAEAAASIVAILRNAFKHVRIIIPSVAKSAATMIALAGDELWMDDDAELGPIDPQLSASDGSFNAPAQAILDQFDFAKEQLKNDPKSMAAWVPMLQKYGPALLQQCRNARDLAENYVTGWLGSSRLLEGLDAAQRAEAMKVPSYLASHNEFKTHGARIGAADLRAKGLPVHVLSEDQKMRDLVYEIHLALRLTFEGTGAFRIWENSRGGALLGLIKMQQVVMPGMPGGPQKVLLAPPGSPLSKK